MYKPTGKISKKKNTDKGKQKYIPLLAASMILGLINI